jgi:hypothetical protein
VNDSLPLVVGLIAYLFFGVSLMSIAGKTGTENGWFGFVPILNLVLLLMIGRRPIWWVIGFFVPFVIIVVVALAWMGVAEARGKSPLLGLLIFVPFVNLAMVGYLAFTD